MLRKYNDHVLNEKKDMKAEKLAIENKILKLFKDKPEIKSGEKWPDAKCIYGLANIKKYVGGDNLKVDQIFNDLKAKDKKIKSISVRISAYKESYPFYYYEDYTTKEEAEKCKVDMEKSQKPDEKKKVVSRDVPERVIAKKKEAPKSKDPRNIKTSKKEPVKEADLKAKAKVLVKRKKG